ncbi:SDR family oxidoreductase [Pseudomonas aeruginosa]|uniref:SDR family oxidoreductase n=1 Tax=Pseudomonas aeruginosa TaxID=287 RepID=UPI0008FB4C91|nr:NmrA family NAD(P)-binding protein [Pseudomonas aeruginosa]
MSKNILIIGATSDISSGVIEHLKNSGHRLKALVRNPAKAKNLERLGVELRVGDLEKPWTLGAAFEGADTAQCHQPKLQPCPRQAPRSSQPPWPSGDDQASAAQSGGLAGLAVM